MARFRWTSLGHGILGIVCLLGTGLATEVGQRSLVGGSLAFEWVQGQEAAIPARKVRALLEAEFGTMGEDSLLFLPSGKTISLSQKEDILNRWSPDWFVSFRMGGALEGGMREAVSCGIIRAYSPAFPDEATALAETLAVTIRSWFALDTCLVFLGRPEDQSSLLAGAAMPSVAVHLAAIGPEMRTLPIGSPKAWRLLGRATHASFQRFLSGGPAALRALAGFVQDRETGEPVSGVSVQLAPTGDRTFLEPGEEGLYAFFDVQPGTCWVEVLDPRFEPLRDQVVIPSDGPVWHDLKLISARSPVIEHCSPTPDSVGVSVTSPIQFEFSRRMDSLAVLAAVHVEPAFPWQAEWSNEGRRLTIRPLRHLRFDTRYVVRIEDGACDRFGHPLDGDGDGYAGGAFELAFRTAPLDTALLEVLEVIPAPGDTGLLPGQIVALTFNRNCGRNGSLEDFVRVVDSRGRTIAARMEACAQPIDSVTGAKGMRLSVVPLVDLTPGEEFRLELRPGFCGGQPDSMLMFRFRASEARWIPWTVEDFRSPRFRWTTRRITGGPEDTASVMIAGGMGFLDTVAARISYQFQTSGATLWVLMGDDSSTSRPRIALGEPVSLALYGDASGLRVRALWVDADGFEYSRPVKVDWCGWGSLVYFSDEALEPGPHGNGHADADSLDFAGLCLQSERPSRGTLYLDRVTVLLKARPAGLDWEERGGRSIDRPADFRLEKNRPNPFRSATEIRFWIGQNVASRSARLEIVNLLGQTVATLWDGPARDGWHQVLWDGRDERGADLPSGIYFARLTVAGSVAIQRLVLLR